jgi:hypothetical protein
MPGFSGKILSQHAPIAAPEQLLAGTTSSAVVLGFSDLKTGEMNVDDRNRNCIIIPQTASETVRKI